MNSKKDQAIKKIMKDFETFAALTMQQLDLLDKVLNSEDSKIPEEALKEFTKNEEKLDKFEVSISGKIINTIVLHQPVASDLRKIFSCYRMALNLERIGDLVINIVYFLDKVKEHKIFARTSGMIDNMFIMSSKMVSKALISFINSDKEFAIWTIKNDVVVDELYNKLMKKSINKGDFSVDTKKLLLDFMDIRSIISNIERIADHATNIAEASIYSLEGTDVRHQDIDEME